MADTADTAAECRLDPVPDLGLGARHFPEPSLFGAGPGADGAAQLLKCTVRFRPTEGSAEATAASSVPVRRRKRVGAGSPPGVCRAARHRAPPGRWRTAPRVFHESLRQPSRSRCGRRGLRGLLTSQPPIHRVPWAIAIANCRVARTVTRSRSLYGAGRAWRRTAPAAPRRAVDGDSGVDVCDGGNPGGRSCPRPPGFARLATAGWRPGTLPAGTVRRPSTGGSCWWRRSTGPGPHRCRRTPRRPPGTFRC